MMEELCSFASGDKLLQKLTKKSFIQFVTGHYFARKMLRVKSYFVW